MLQKSLAEAAKLKDEGNAFFKKKEYQQAYLKYTDAIENDERNAVLYANRAACSLSLRRWAASRFEADLASNFIWL